MTHITPSPLIRTKFPSKIKCSLFKFGLGIISTLRISRVSPSRSNWPRSITSSSASPSGLTPNTTTPSPGRKRAQLCWANIFDHKIFSPLLTAFNPASKKLDISSSSVHATISSFVCTFSRIQSDIPDLMSDNCASTIETENPKKTITNNLLIIIHIDVCVDMSVPGVVIIHHLRNEKQINKRANNDNATSENPYYPCTSTAKIETMESQNPKCTDCPKKISSADTFFHHR